MHRLVVMGQGYVGLPVALRAGEQGLDVIGFDAELITGHARYVLDTRRFLAGEQVEYL